MPAALAGTYVSADTGAVWRIERNGDDWGVAVSGPLIAGGPPWPVQGIDADTVEVASPAGGWLTVSQLAHIVRDKAGKRSKRSTSPPAASRGCASPDRTETRCGVILRSRPYCLPISVSSRVTR